MEENGAVVMVIEQSNNRLTIQEKETKTREIVLVFILNSGFCFLGYWLIEDIDWIVVPTWVKVLTITTGIFFILLLVGSMIFKLPSIFTFDRGTGVLTILHRTRFSERKKVYPLQDIKDVILMKCESWKHGDSYHTHLVIQRRKYNDYLKDERVEIPGERNDYYRTLNEAEVVASFLGLEIKEETRIVRNID